MKSPIQDPLNQALALHSAGDLAKAEAIYRRILQTDPDQPVALHMLGVIAHQGGNHQQAVDLITMALAYQPDYANAHYNLGNALKALGRLEDAAASYRRALELNPELAEAHDTLGNVFQDLGRLSEAIGCYRAALAIDPNYAGGHFNLGNAQKASGAVDDAIVSYQKALAITPAYAEAHYNLGNAYDEMGRIDDAIASFRAAVSHNPSYAQAHYNLGKTLMRQDRSDDAISAFKNVLGLEDAEARVGAELALAHFGVMAAPERTPTEYLKGYYKSRAKDWGKAAWDENIERYQGYKLISRVLDLESLGRTELAILDAGCGAGPLGPLLRPFAAHLEGVDLSPEMLEQAGKQGHYDALVDADLADYLAGGDRQFDGIVCAAVLVHFSVLDQIIGQFQCALKDGGFLALTVFSDGECEKFSVNASGFFSHNPDYVKAAAADAGFSLVREEHGVHEIHGAKEILGAGFLFRKSAD